MPRCLLSSMGDHTLSRSNCQIGWLAASVYRAAWRRCGNQATAAGLRVGPFEVGGRTRRDAASTVWMTVRRPRLLDTVRTGLTIGLILDRAREALAVVVRIQAAQSGCRGRFRGGRRPAAHQGRQNPPERPWHPAQWRKVTEQIAKARRIHGRGRGGTSSPTCTVFEHERLKSR